MALDADIRNDKNFPWETMAAKLQLDRWRLYHWYFETFQRTLSANFTKEDSELMKDLIREAFSQGKSMDKPFQNEIK